MSYALLKKNKEAETASASVSPSRSSRSPEVTSSGALKLFYFFLFVIAAYYSWSEQLYTTDSNFAYYLGIVGGVMMLILFMYPIRKHFPQATFLGPLRGWFRVHMFCGIAGPLFVLFHATFKSGSVNATVALGSMLLVAASGLFGRFIYARIHTGLYGQKTTLRELQSTYSQQAAVLESIRARVPLIGSQVDVCLAYAGDKSGSAFVQGLRVFTLGYVAWQTESRCRNILLSQFGADREINEAVLSSIRHFLRAVVKLQQFTLFERIFRLWHVAHVPFVVLLVFSSVVHIIAVHLY